MDKKKLDELRDYYDNTDMSAEIADAQIDDEIVESPMVGITVRMPAATLQRVREQAASEGIKPTALIRRWVEQRVQMQAIAPAGRRVLNVENLESSRMEWGFITALVSNFVPDLGVAGRSGLLLHEDCVHANEIPVGA